MTSLLEGDAEYLIRTAELDTDGIVPVGKLIAHRTGALPRRARIRGEAELVYIDGVLQIFVRSGLFEVRARWLACHALAHGWLMPTKREYPANAEEQADAQGAMLIAPVRAIRSAVRR